MEMDTKITEVLKGIEVLDVESAVKFSQGLMAEFNARCCAAILIPFCDKYGFEFHGEGMFRGGEFWMETLIPKPGKSWDPDGDFDILQMNTEEKVDSWTGPEEAKSQLREILRWLSTDADGLGPLGYCLETYVPEDKWGVLDRYHLTLDSEL